MTRIPLTLAALAAFAAAAPAAAQYNNGYGGYAAGDVDIQGLGAEIDTAASSGALSSQDASELRSQLRGLVNLQRQYSSNGLSASERTDLQQRAQGLRNEIAQAGGSAAGYGRPGYDARTPAPYGAGDRGYANGYASTGTPRAPYNGGAYGNGYGGAPVNNGPYGNAYGRPGYAGGPAYNGGAYGNAYTGPGYPGPGYNGGAYGNAYPNGYNGGAYANRGYAANQYGRYDRGQAYRDDRDDGYDDEDGVELRVGDRATGMLYGVPDEYRARFRDSPYVYYRYGAGNVYQIDARTGMVSRVIRVDR